MATVANVRFEHYHAPNTVGVHETRPRLSWVLVNAPSGFQQLGYEIELTDHGLEPRHRHTVSSAKRESTSSTLVPWPFDKPLQSRQEISVRVRVWDGDGTLTDWSEPAALEVGLLDRADWACERITAPWAPLASAGPDAEHLYRKPFSLSGSTPVAKARLYITAQGVYEAEMNGRRVGDHFLAPGWTAYDGRLQYQTYDVSSALAPGANCLAVRVAEGWFCGRIGFEGGHRNIWGPHPALMAQLEITYADGRVQAVCTDASWAVTKGPIRLAEIYDGEKYDARLEVPCWSSADADAPSAASWLSPPWEPVLSLPPLADAVKLTAGFGEPVRRVETVQPLQKIVSPSGKTILDFGQNLVGYVRLKHVRGPRGQEVTLTHAEVLEDGELCTRTLRLCKATDGYILSGVEEGEQYEPRFTFHGFRYAQIDGWPGELDLSSVEAVVCHTDMRSAGSFACSEPLLNRLHENVRWSMRGNFLSVPTDCPQRDERLGWTGDLALFVPTAVLIYDCFGMLRNWLVDVAHDQRVLGGVPPMMSPNATLPDPVWCRTVPCAIWHDVTVLAPWTLYEETGDLSILAQQYDSMLEWMRVLPRNKSGATHLWDTSVFQLGDWLDPAAPPDQPWKSATDSKMVANMFLIRSLDLMARISALLGREPERARFAAEAALARAEFHDEYVRPNGRVVSDTQAAYALAICLDVLSQPAQRARAGARLAELVRRAAFRIGTGFAATPFLCEALAATGHMQVAFAALLETGCPSWLYPVAAAGATTVWERWDGLLPGSGRVNPGEMTSFNHYALGAVARFLHERVAGLRRLEPGWTRVRVAPAVGARFTSAEASHVTRRGTVSCRWKTRVLEAPGSAGASEGGEGANGGLEAMELSVSVPYGTAVEIVMPVGAAGERRETVGPGNWEFQTTFMRAYEWPVKPLKPKS